MRVPGEGHTPLQAIVWDYDSPPDYYLVGNPGYCCCRWSTLRVTFQGVDASIVGCKYTYWNQFYLWPLSVGLDGSYDYTLTKRVGYEVIDYGPCQIENDLYKNNHGDQLGGTWESFSRRFVTVCDEPREQDYGNGVWRIIVMMSKCFRYVTAVRVVTSATWLEQAAAFRWSGQAEVGSSVTLTNQNDGSGLDYAAGGTATVELIP